MCIRDRAIPTEEHSGDGTYGEGEEYTPRLDEDGPVGNALHYPAGSASDEDVYKRQV